MPPLPCSSESCRSDTGIEVPGRREPFGARRGAPRRERSRRHPRQDHRAGDGRRQRGDGRAEAEGRVVVSADTDFGTLLAHSGKRAPSVILFRLAGQRRAWSRVALILANLPEVTADLEAGALVVIEAGRVRSRRLPLIPD